MIEAALELAETGVAVFPVGPDKAPRTANGFHDATTDANKILNWTPEWQDGGIGAAVPDGFVVIDVDPRNGGTDTLKLLAEAGRKLPRTRTARTRSGGFHYWLRVPADTTLRSKLGPGVDVKRAGKGYVVVPPSAGYVWLPGTDEAAEAPEWLLEELLVPETDSALGEASEAKFFSWDDGTAYGLAALDRELGRLATAREGERNNALNRAAFALAQLVAGGELSEQRVVEDLVLASERIGLHRDEATATLASGWKAGMQEPRQAPERAPVEVKSELWKAEDVLADPSALRVDGPLLVAEPRDLWVDWEIDEPPLPFYIHPVLPKNAYVLVYGATEASKSMVWVALCAEASQRGQRCSVYSLENPPGIDRDRLRRLRPSRSNFRLTNEPIDLNDARQLQELVERERDWGDGRASDVVVIDTYSHAFNSRSEDGNARAIEFARRIRHLMHEVGCSVVLIDHTGYGQTDEPRDASAKRQQVDVAFLMQKVGEWKPGQAAGFAMTNKKPARFANPCHLNGEIRDVMHGDQRGLELAWIGAERPSWPDE